MTFKTVKEYLYKIPLYLETKIFIVCTNFKTVMLQIWSEGL